MKLHFRSLGQGPALIILHGLFGSSDNWQTLAKRFAEHYTVYLVDQRNHGRSPHSEEFSYELLATDLRNFMLEHNLDSAIILGHSMGGKTAMKFALTHPDMVSKLIVADIAPKAYPPHHDEILDTLKAVDITTATSRSEIETQVARTNPEESTRLFLLKNLYRKEDNSFAWRVNLLSLDKNMPNVLAEIHAGNPYTGPTLFIRGGKSRYIKPEDYVAIEHLFPNVEIETIEEAGHWLHAEAPDEFYDLVTRFLETSDSW